MDLKVLWTDSAIEQLEGIFDFYNFNVSLKVAREIVSGILEKTILLETHPKIGQIEELLKERAFEYRYIVVNNFKVIYWIYEPNVYIATVFDCRQNPVKMTVTE